MTIIIVISVIVLGVLFKFLSDTKNLNKQIQQEGGMRKKFAPIVDELLSQDSLTTVQHEDENSISIGTVNHIGKTLITITQLHHGIVNFHCKFDSAHYGQHEFSREYENSVSQLKMLESFLDSTSRFKERVQSTYWQELGSYMHPGDPADRR